jgi:Uma2 family endonuclease
VLQLLQEQAGAWRRARKGSRVIPGVDNRLGGGLVYRPDLAIFAPGRLKTTPERLDLPPDLVVEVLSPSSKATDMIKKRGDYERFGVREYWVIDPENGRAKAWIRQGSQFVEWAIEGQLLAASSFDGFVLDLSSLRSLE